MGNSEVPQAPGSTRKNEKAAFTRIELLAVLVGLVVLAALALPVLASSTANSQRAECFNNLRQIGRGVRQWAGDHFEEPPWLTSVISGGTRPDSGTKAGAAWTEYLSLSNELVTPRILACPGDTGAKIATDWSSGPNALVNAAFRQQSVSYMLGLHANSIRPQALVAADFNLRGLSTSATCGPAAMNNVASILGTVGAPASLAPYQWTNGPHSTAAGHLLVVDGSVTFLDSMGFARTLSPSTSTETGVHHLLRAH